MRKYFILTGFFVAFLFTAPARAQQCLGNACDVIKVSYDIAKNVVITNTGQARVKIAIKWYNKQCLPAKTIIAGPGSSTTYAPYHVFCPPFTANYVKTAAVVAPKIVDGQVTFVNPKQSGGVAYVYGILSKVSEFPLDFCSGKRVILGRALQPGGSFVYILPPGVNLFWASFNTTNCDTKHMWLSGSVNRNNCAQGCQVNVR